MRIEISSYSTLPLLFAGALLALFELTGCLDIMGEQEIVTEQQSQEKDGLTDDDIADKNPVFDPDMRVVDRFGDFLVSLNKSGSVIRLDIGPMDTEADEAINDRLFPTYAAALADLPGATIPSLEVVNNKLKSFNDSFYAGIEEGVYRGIAEAYNGKVALYTDIMNAIVDGRATADAAHDALYVEAAARFAAGLMVAGIAPDVPADVQTAADALVVSFEQRPLLASPMGFYTWTDTLEAVFRLDRFHQQWAMGPPLSLYSQASPSFGSLLLTAHIIQQDAQRTADYLAILELYAGLTNPYSSYTVADLFDATSDLSVLDNVSAAQAAFESTHPEIYESLGVLYKPIALVPSSESPETILFNRIFPQGVPEGVEVMDALIAAIMSGEVDLSPSDNSGWYDYQLYALETLLLPERGAESAKLLLTKAYKEKLIETFKTIITQTRETHAKQVTIGGEDSAANMEPVKIDVYPVLHAEPFPTFYLRQARAYRFVGTAVAAALGQDFLDQTMVVSENGVGEIALSHALNEITLLAYGLHYLTLENVGLHADVLPEEADAFPENECVDAALTWLYGESAVQDVPPNRATRGWASDPDVEADPRVLVPVHLDGDGNAVYWAVIGVKAIRIRAEYEEGFEPIVQGCDGVREYEMCEVEAFVPYEPYILMGTQVEVRISSAIAPPTRDEFRALCDENVTEEAIVQALEAL